MQLTEYIHIPSFNRVILIVLVISGSEKTDMSYLYGFRFLPFGYGTLKTPLTVANFKASSS